MREIIIVGNPNTGKTTVFNTITKSNEKTANYSGVTVKEKEKIIVINGEPLKVVDLPGVYSLRGGSEDENSAIYYLKKHPSSEILFLCTPLALSKNLLLLDELIENGFTNVKILINAFNKKLDDNLIKTINKKFNVSALQVNAKKEKNKLIDFILNKKTASGLSIKIIDEIIKMIPEDVINETKLDKLLLHNIWGKLIFFAVIFFVFVLSFGKFGAGLSHFVEVEYTRFSSFILKLFVNKPVLFDFLDKVVFGAFKYLLMFLPELGVLLTLLYILEDVGYLPRVAKLFNLPLSKFGMTGKSVFSIIMGVGCTTSGFVCSRNVDGKKARCQTARFLPFVGCSARIPIFLLVAGFVLKQNSLWFVLIIYLISVFMGLGVIPLFNAQKGNPDFVVELVPLKRPNIISSIKKALLILFDLVKKIFISCFIVSCIIWLLINVSTSFKFGTTAEESLLVYISNLISFIFKPLGLGEAKFIAPLLSGLVAKENILGTMVVMGGIGEENLIVLLSFTLFILFYSPCVPALIALKKEMGKRIMWQIFFMQNIMAYLVSFIFYNFATFFNIWVGVVVIMVFMILVVLFSKTQKVCKNCSIKNFV